MKKIPPFTVEENMRFVIRRETNGRPYPDNPHGLPYDNDGNLLSKELLLERLTKYGYREH